MSSSGADDRGWSISSSSAFALSLASAVALVTSAGKFINGVFVDVAGARRLLVLYGTCTCLSLVRLGRSSTPGSAVAFCAAVKFFGLDYWPVGVRRAAAATTGHRMRGGSRRACT